jgi:hypothetical protein
MLRPDDLNRIPALAADLQAKIGDHDQLLRDACGNIIGRYGNDVLRAVLDRMLHDLAYRIGQVQALYDDMLP